MKYAFEISIDGIKLRLKRSVRTARSVKLEELRRGVAESFTSRRRHESTEGEDFEANSQSADQNNVPRQAEKGNFANSVNFVYAGD